MLRINAISIHNIGRIKSLDLSFDDHFNIICGSNGIGKTTILDCIAQSYSFNRISVKKTANAQNGHWITQGLYNGIEKISEFNIQAFHPNENTRDNYGHYQQANEVIVFKTHRDIPYKTLSSINSDPQKNEHHFFEEAVNGTLSGELKDWFVNRHLWSGHTNHLSDNQLKNIGLARECFSILDDNIQFSRVNPNTNDIMLATELGEIYFEYLSSGYKSCIAVLIGLIKEIEYRYTNPSKYVKEFDGIILIDEIDLHLHPEWQAKIYLAIKKILPSAQLFTTTHSPHIIQVANPKEIIPLILDESNDVKVNPIINQEYGCQGWTVEEVLRDVMRMTETRTDTYIHEINSFNSAVENEDYETANQHFQILEQMLHPENSLRKILKIQLTGLREND